MSHSVFTHIEQEWVIYWVCTYSCLWESLLEYECLCRYLLVYSIWLTGLYGTRSVRCLQLEIPSYAWLNWLRKWPRL